MPLALSFPAACQNVCFLPKIKSWFHSCGDRALDCDFETITTKNNTNNIASMLQQRRHTTAKILSQHRNTFCNQKATTQQSHGNSATRAANRNSGTQMCQTSLRLRPHIPLKIIHRRSCKRFICWDLPSLCLASCTGLAHMCYFADNQRRVEGEQRPGG